MGFLAKDPMREKTIVEKLQHRMNRMVLTRVKKVVIHSSENSVYMLCFLGVFLH